LVVDGFSIRADVSWRWSP